MYHLVSQKSQRYLELTFKSCKLWALTLGPPPPKKNNSVVLLLLSNPRKQVLCQKSIPWHFFFQIGFLFFYFSFFLIFFFQFYFTPYKQNVHEATDQFWIMSGCVFVCVTVWLSLGYILRELICRVKFKTGLKVQKVQLQSWVKGTWYKKIHASIRHTICNTRIWSIFCQHNMYRIRSNTCSCPYNCPSTSFSV